MAHFDHCFVGGGKWEHCTSEKIQTLTYGRDKIRLCIHSDKEVSQAHSMYLSGPDLSFTENVWRNWKAWLSYNTFVRINRSKLLQTVRSLWKNIRYICRFLYSRSVEVGQSGKAVMEKININLFATLMSKGLKAMVRKKKHM